uniref:Uncharacterized protein n=1 Tax=Oryza punctata TaxID=4537 RepID=A0A0E0JJA4_ORYPU
DPYRAGPGRSSISHASLRIRASSLPDTRIALPLSRTSLRIPAPTPHALPSRVTAVAHAISSSPAVTNLDPAVSDPITVVTPPISNISKEWLTRLPRRYLSSLILKDLNLKVHSFSY